MWNGLKHFILLNLKCITYSTFRKFSNEVIMNKKFTIRRLFLRYLLPVPITIIFFLLIWFIFSIHRIIDLRAYYQSLQNEQINNFIIIPDSLKKNHTMPDFTRIDWQKFSTELDFEGIKVTNYDETGNRGISGIQRYPSSIAGYAEKNLQDYIKWGNEDNLLIALRQIDYLANEFKTVRINKEEVGLWYVNFDLGYQYNVKAPWRSGFNQVYCLEAMLYGFQITNDSNYIRLFGKGIKAYKYSTSEGGLSYSTKNGGLFFQEVVTSFPLHHILNGHMIALIKIHNCILFSGSSEAREIFNLGVIGLKDMLNLFDRYGYSLYSLSPNPSFVNHFNIASPAYHNLHIAQLRTLAQITGEKIFTEYADKWQSESGGIKEFFWITIYVMFKDIMRTVKSVENTIGISITGK